MPQGHSRETGKSTWESRYMTWKDIEMKKYKREEEKERPAPSPWQPFETKNRDGETWGTPIQLYCAGGRPPAMAAVGLPGSRWWEGGDYIQKRGRGKRLRIRFHLSTQYKTTSKTTSKTKTAYCNRSTTIYLSVTATQTFPSPIPFN